MTLIEALSVTAILALLAALLFPIVARVRERARQAVCASQMRQMGVALRQYASDNEGALPLTSHGGAETAWGRTTRAYGLAPALRLCPSDPWAARRRAAGGSSYVLNEHLLGERAGRHDAGGQTPVTFGEAPGLDGLARPAQTPLAFEQAGGAPGPEGDHIHNRAWTSDPRGLWAAMAGDLDLRAHRDGVHVLYADGHLVRLTIGRLRAWADARIDFSQPQE